MSKGFCRYGHYKVARRIIAKSHSLEEVALMTDEEVEDYIYDHYVVLEHYDHSEDNHEEELILIPRDAFNSIEGVESIYR